MGKALTAQQKQDREDKKLAYEVAKDAFNEAVERLPEHAAYRYFDYRNYNEDGTWHSINEAWPAYQSAFRALPEFAVYKDAHMAHFRRADEWVLDNKWKSMRQPANIIYGDVDDKGNFIRAKSCVRKEIKEHRKSIDYLMARPVPRQAQIDVHTVAIVGLNAQLAPAA
jgi:tetratricopeptide (TPR) repeat protein